MLFKPKWVRLLPAHLRPDSRRIRQLEELRVEFAIPHDALALRVLSSPSTTRKAQRHCLEQFKTENPEASEKELLRMVLISRLMAPPVTPMTPEEVDTAMENINSFEDLCEFIIAQDEESPAVGADAFGIGERIDAVLAQERVDQSSREPKETETECRRGPHIESLARQTWSLFEVCLFRREEEIRTTLVSLGHCSMGSSALNQVTAELDLFALFQADFVGFQIFAGNLEAYQDWKTGLYRGYHQRLGRLGKRYADGFLVHYLLREKDYYDAISGDEKGDPFDALCRLAARFAIGESASEEVEAFMIRNVEALACEMLDAWESYRSHYPQLSKREELPKDARDRQLCVSNLLLIDYLKQEWAESHGKRDGDDVVEHEVFARGEPTCPAGGTYTYGRVGERPKCSISGHVLSG